jgi:hypothetical protein
LAWLNGKGDLLKTIAEANQAIEKRVGITLNPDIERRSLEKPVKALQDGTDSEKTIASAQVIPHTPTKCIVSPSCFVKLNSGSIFFLFFSNREFAFWKKNLQATKKMQPRRTIIPVTPSFALSFFFHDFQGVEPLLYDERET